MQGFLIVFWIEQFMVLLCILVIRHQCEKAIEDIWRVINELRGEKTVDESLPI